MFIVKNASQHQQPAKNCANLFLHLVSCLLYVFFYAMASWPKQKAVGKRLQKDGAESGRQTACQSSPRFG